ncbi:hypothetical protein PR202_ga22463 [Eleusine coracana subsp. coracana]|uniref:Uncharacterized protein n=1 Tax=Eleusine coracana subsp. coracana TaxID=191504 RepID=A0AAV5D463_ELECO|nr:hypothetical protein PR202_ga22463 [Eleusine coracana subsp. coracana]
MAEAVQIIAKSMPPPQVPMAKPTFLWPPEGELQLLMEDADDDDLVGGTGYDDSEWSHREESRNHGGGFVISIGSLEITVGRSLMACPDKTAVEENLPSTTVGATTSEGDSEADFARSLEDNLIVAPEGLGHDHGRDPLKDVEDDEEEDDGDEEEDEEEGDEEEGGDKDFAPRGVGRVATDTQGQSSSRRV